MKRTITKLAARRETIRALVKPEMIAVASGGQVTTPPTGKNCPETDLVAARANG
jgi:hypothetical protein